MSSCLDTTKFRLSIPNSIKFRRISGHETARNRDVDSHRRAAGPLPNDLRGIQNTRADRARAAQEACRVHEDGAVAHSADLRLIGGGRHDAQIIPDIPGILGQEDIVLRQESVYDLGLVVG